MAETKRCSTCHRELPPNAPSGLCSRCLLQRALDESGITDVDPFIEESSALDPASFHATAEDPARYAGQREYARGGMGRILLAQDEQVGREVLIKELLPKRLERAQETSAVGGQAVSASAGGRFLREARVTGQLEHPGVVPVYEIGYREDGTLFYTMKNVRGRSLLEAIHQAPDLEARLKLLPHLLDVCQAAAYAHSRGVIHRDIKPSNIMVGEFGETVLLDWGLAKVRDLGEPDELSVPTSLGGPPPDDGLGQDATSDGQVLGTPAYMAPEQARGAVEELDERTDVYALGAALYTLLTGQAPFGGASRAEIIRSVLEDSPTRILDIVPNAPRELVAIAEKAMAKDSEDRYVSAGALADELRQYLSGGLVRAYEYNPAEHLVRFAGKHRTGVVAALACVVLLLAFASSAYVRTAKERDLAIEERDRAARAEYARTIPLAALRIERGEIGPALKLLQPCPSALRGWEWGHLMGQCHPEESSVQAHEGRFTAFAAGPDETRLVTCGADGTLAGWKTATLEEVWRQSCASPVQALAFVPDGRSFAGLTAAGNLLVMDADTGEVLYESGGAGQSAQAERDVPAPKLLFDPEGTRLYGLTGQTVTVWRCDDWRVDKRFEVARVGECMGLAWSAKGSVLVVVGRDGRYLQIEGLAADTGDPLWFRDELTLHSSAFGVLAKGYGNGTGLLCHYGKSLWAFGLSEEGPRKLLELELPRDRMAPVTCAGVLPDGSLYAVARADGTVLTFSSERKELVSRISTGTGVQHVVFTVGGAGVITADEKGILKRIHRTPIDQPPNRLAFLESDLGMRCNFVSFSPDSRYLAASNERVPERVTIWDLETGTRRSLPTPKGAGEYIDFEPNTGELMISAPGSLRFYHVDDWTPTRELEIEGDIHGGQFDASGRLLVTKSAGAKPRVLDMSTGMDAMVLPDVPFIAAEQPYDMSVAIALAGDKCAITSNSSGATWVIRIPEGDVLPEISREGASVPGPKGLAFHPDGQLLAVGYTDGLVVVRDVLTGATVSSFEDPGGEVFCLTFGPDGHRLATTTEVGYTRVWDWASGVELLDARSISSFAQDVAFSPDGSMLALADANLATTQLLLGEDGGVRQGRWRQWQEGREACRDTLLRLDTIALSWAQRNGAQAGSPMPGLVTVLTDEGVPVGEVRCPSGGTYLLGAVGEAPACSTHTAFSYDIDLAAQALEGAYERQSDFSIAICESRLMEALVDSPGFLNSIAWKWAREEGHYHEAAVMAAERAVELVPQDGLLLDTLAWAEYKAGRLNSAVDHFREAVENGCDSRPALALSLTTRGTERDLEEACDLLEAFLTRAPIDEDVEATMAALRAAAPSASDAIRQRVERLAKMEGGQ